ncbi:MAG: peptidylprolyl isomerase [Dehalococcoidia bacterium]
MTSRRQRRQQRPGTQSASSVRKYKPPFPLNLLSSQITFYVIGLLAIVGSLFFFGNTALFGDDNPTNSDVIDITPEETGTPDPNDPNATATEEPVEIQQFDAPPVFTLDPEKDYVAVIETERGEVTIDLLEDEAPLTVNNFVFLANEGFYDGQQFFRVIPDFLAQAGDPTALGTGGPGYDLNPQPTPTPEPTPSATPEATGEAEATATPEFSEVPEPTEPPTPGPTPTPEGGENQPDPEEGLVAVAFDNLSGVFSGSQFFILLGDELTIEKGEYIAFGRVLEGLEILRLLTPRDPADIAPPDGDRIVSIRIVEQ